MQKAGEPENVAGFPKHNYSQLNCSCYSYPSKPIIIIASEASFLVCSMHGFSIYIPYVVP